MMIQYMHLQPWDWDVILFYDTCAGDIDTVSSELRRIGCEGGDYERARRKLEDGFLNTGFTVSVVGSRSTVCVIGRSSSSAQFWNTFDHEKGHVAEHIGDALGLPEDGEEIQYLKGMLAQKTYPYAVEYLCRCQCSFRHDFGTSEANHVKL